MTWHYECIHTCFVSWCWFQPAGVFFLFFLSGAKISVWRMGRALPSINPLRGVPFLFSVLDFVCFISCHFIGGGGSLIVNDRRVVLFVVWYIGWTVCVLSFFFFRLQYIYHRYLQQWQWLYIVNGNSSLVSVRRSIAYMKRIVSLPISFRCYTTEYITSSNVSSYIFTLIFIAFSKWSMTLRQNERQVERQNVRPTNYISCDLPTYPSSKHPIARTYICTGVKIPSPRQCSWRHDIYHIPERRSRTYNELSWVYTYSYSYIWLGQKSWHYTYKYVIYS